VSGLRCVCTGLRRSRSAPAPSAFQGGSEQPVCGFRNPTGSQCFLATALQLIVACPEVVALLPKSADGAVCAAPNCAARDPDDKNLVESRPGDPKRRGWCASCSLGRLLAEYKAASAAGCAASRRASAFTPSEIYQHATKLSPEFKPPTQNDAHEALLLLLRHLSVAHAPLWQGEGNNNPVMDVISLKTRTILSWDKCSCPPPSDGHRHTHTPPLDEDSCYGSLVVSLKYAGPQATSLQSILDEYLQEEVLQDEERYRCPRCREACSNTKKGFKVLHAPPALFLHVNRQSHGGHVGFHRPTRHSSPAAAVSNKQLFRLEFSPSLQLHDGKGEHTYTLAAVGAHSGNDTKSGHWWTYVHLPGDSPQWVMLDDSSISTTSWEAVAECRNGQWQDPTPCLLLYRRAAGSSSSGANTGSAAVAAAPTVDDAEDLPATSGGGRGGCRPTPTVPYQHATAASPDGGDATQEEGCDAVVNLIRTQWQACHPARTTMLDKKLQQVRHAVHENQIESTTVFLNFEDAWPDLHVPQWLAVGLRKLKVADAQAQAQARAADIADKASDTAAVVHCRVQLGATARRLHIQAVPAPCGGGARGQAGCACLRSDGLRQRAHSHRVRVGIRTHGGGGVTVVVVDRRPGAPRPQHAHPRGRSEGRERLRLALHGHGGAVAGVHNAGAGGHAA
jgi:hypothetical protein